jgi:hypothetical protein
VEKLNRNTKTLFFSVFLACVLLSFVSVARADITIVEGYAISIGRGYYLTMGKDMTFATPVTYANGFTDGNGFWINSSRDLTLGCWFENNWINYTATGLSSQYVFNGSKPTLVILSGSNATEEHGWSYSATTHVIFIMSMPSVEIYFGVLSTPPLIPPSSDIPPSAVDAATGYSPIVYGYNVSMYYPKTSSLGIQAEATLNFLVSSGTWDAYRVNMTVYPDWGIIYFLPAQDVNLTVTTIGTSEVFLSVSGEGSNLTKISESEWQVSFSQPYSSSISWSSKVISYVDLYTMMAVGLVGVGMMIVIPCWIAWHIKDHGLDTETWNRIFLGMAFFFMGMGLFLVWIWP